MKTRAEFLRDAKNGMVLKMVLCNGKTLDQVIEQDPEMTLKYTKKMHDFMNRFRKISKVQSNAIYIEDSYLEIPNAKQFEYDGKAIKIYRVGYRELNEQERAVMDEWKEITKTPEYQRDSMNDAYTDGTQTFYQEKYFFEKKGFPYLFGMKESGGKSYVTYYYGAQGERFDGEFIRDNSIQGILSFEYEVKGAE